MSARRLNILLAPLGAVMALVMIYVFYASPLRQRIENKLFDIRTRVSPSFPETGDVVLISIDAKTIASLDGPAAKELSGDALRRIVAAALMTEAKQVAVLIPPQVFSYRDPETSWTFGLAQRDPRLLIGTFDLTTKQNSPDAIPEMLLPVKDRVVKADAERYFRREIVRDFIIKQAGELPYLPYVLTGAVSASRREALDKLPAEDGKTTVKLNYFDPALMTEIKAEDLVATADKQANGRLDGRIVLIGYTSYRPTTMQHREATLVNSPWQADGYSVELGMPVLYVQAIALVNLLKGIWLSPAPTWANVLHVLLLTGLTLTIWRFSVGFASFLFIGGWCLVILVHALLFAVANVFFPLADVALASSLAMIGMALYRLSVEGRLRALHEAKASSERELAAVQDRFLNRFSFELGTINSQAKIALERHAALRRETGAIQDAYVRALGSCEELEDYLRGIQHFASMQGKGLATPPLVAFDVMEVIDKVLRQFESRLSEAKLTVELSGQKPSMALADPTLSAQIFYNLISNATKYSPPGSVIHITVTREGENLAIRVKDHGPGIAAQYQERIFEKFYRIKDDKVYKLKGHGLGLYLSRYFAGLIGGDITVSSSVGKGAEFTLSLRGSP